ncbi:MAG: MMPL family transporter [Gammaproteobacteria bacterium]|nr:MAG: MMPL family transporter [Gammaproteobacteria bacterium]
MNLGEAIVARLWRRRKSLLLVGILVSLVPGLNLRHLGVDNALDIWFLQDDPALLEYRRFQQWFGHDEAIVIALKEDTGMLNVDALNRVLDLSDTIAEVDGIAGVNSLLTQPGAREISLSAGGSVSGQTITEIKQLLRDTPDLRGRWLSANNRLLVLVASIGPQVDIDHERERILVQVREILDSRGGTYHLAGFGVIYSALNQASTDDSALVTTIAYGLIMALLALLYQKVKPLLIVITTASLGATAVMGVYAAAGRDINMVTMIIPTLILVTSVSTSVHLILSIARVSAEVPMCERIVRGVGAMFWPCLINTVTTAAGFLSLMASPMPVIYDLGLFAAIGLAFTFLLSLCVTLSFSAGTSIQSVSVPIRRIGRFARAMTRIAVRSPHRISLVAIGVALIASMGLRDLQIDTYSIEFLFEDHVVRQDSAAIERDIGSYMNLDYTIEHPHNVLQPEIFAATADWQNRVVDAGLAQWSLSAASEYQKLAENSAFALPALSELGDYLPAELIHGSTTLRVSFGVPMQSARQVGNTIDRISELAGLPTGFQIRPAGYLPLYVQMMRHIVETQLQSFALAFGLIMLVLSLLFRSVQQLLLIAISNLLPILVLLGTMGWLGIRLDAATVTIAAIVFGLIVDDTVQFLYRYREERKNSDVPEALLKTADTAGHAMTITTLVMIAGFSVLALAAIKSIVFFGLLVSLAMVAALLTDLLVLPAVLALRSPRDNA